MPRKKTHEEFVQEVYDLVNDEYTVIGRYEHSLSKILMKHNDCGCEWKVRPNDFLHGSKCVECSKQTKVGKKRKTPEQFQKEVYELVGDEYSVLSEYKLSKIKIKIRHNKCGYEYEVKPADFLIGNRCSICRGVKKRTQEEFEKEVFDLVGNEYEVVGEYKSAKITIKMKHNNCGHEWDVKPSNFFHGGRCPKCNIRAKKTQEKFVKEVFDLVGNEYVVLGEYKGANEKVKMKHNKCGYEWDSLASGIVNDGYLCPKCRESHGERKISKWLEKRNIRYEREYMFDNCRYKNPLPFDFAVYFNDDFLVLIEFDGEQHFRAVKHWGGEKAFKLRKLKDKIKTDYCKDNNIPLIRIPYWDFDKIDSKLENHLKNLCSKAI